MTLLASSVPGCKGQAVDFTRAYLATVEASTHNWKSLAHMPKDWMQKRYANAFATKESWIQASAYEPKIMLATARRFCFSPPSRGFPKATSSGRGPLLFNRSRIWLEPEKGLVLASQHPISIKVVSLIQCLNARTDPFFAPFLQKKPDPFS